MSELNDKVLADLTQAIENDELVLPTLPEVALSVRRAAQDPDISISTLASEIGSDAALTTRLIKVANSPLLRAHKDITDLHTAISRLGINYTCTLATGLAMEQIFQATSPVVDRKMREIWRKSSEIAGMCYMLCRHYTRLAPNEATLAGLVHRIGALPILTYAEQHPEVLTDARALDQVIEQSHSVLGDRILRHWEMPEPIVSVPGNYLDFTRDSLRVDYIDIVQVATLLSYIGTDHPCTELEWSRIPAFAKLGLDPDVDMHNDVEFNDTINAAKKMLH